MCGLCGLIGEKQEWSDQVKSDLPLRQNRLKKIKLINKILHYRRLTVSDFHGVSYLLQTPTGKSAIVSGLDNLWDECKNISGHSIDVLNPDLLSFIEDNK
ncbi:hypothetical protein [Bartonella sp. HY038]|uniref:hypothetical protein n=1 Tax=Bartonella sp. HY038 TaxID=2759660 RepID=UPI0015FA401B|nr:hypothetical protein [Bartonella sp. HY038]